MDHIKVKVFKEKMRRTEKTNLRFGNFAKPFCRTKYLKNLHWAKGICLLFLGGTSRHWSSVNLYVYTQCWWNPARLDQTWTSDWQTSWSASRKAQFVLFTPSLGRVQNTVSRTREVFPTGSTMLLRLQLWRTRDCAHRSRHVGFFSFFFFSFGEKGACPK